MPKGIFRFLARRRRTRDPADETPPAGAPPIAHVHPARLWFEAQGAPVVERNRYFIICLGLLLALAAACIALAMMAPLKTVVVCAREGRGRCGGACSNGSTTISARRSGKAIFHCPMGAKDEVDNRFWTRLGGQFMTAGLARIISPPEGGGTILGGAGNSLAGDAAGQILVNTASMGFAGNAALGPVIVIKRGYPFVIMVNRDMDFSTLGARTH